MFSLSILIFSFRYKSEFFYLIKCFVFVRLTIILIISKPIYDLSTFEFYNTYKIICHITLEKEKIKKILNKIEPTVEPCATPDVIV